MGNFNFYKDWLLSHGKFLKEYPENYNPFTDPDEYKNGHYTVVYDLYINGEPEVAISCGDISREVCYKEIYNECQRYIINESRRNS